MKNLQLVVLDNNHQPKTDSKKLADSFGKRHADILRKIEGILEETEPNFTERNFTLSEYIDSTGRTLKMYEMNRDGFMYIARTFTGRKGNDFAVAVIKAFNQMEQSLQNQNQPPKYDVVVLLKMATAEIEQERTLRLIETSRANELERTKSHISDNKTATALGRVGGLVTSNNNLRLVVKSKDEIIEDLKTTPIVLELESEIQKLKENQGLAGEYRTILAWANEYTQLQDKKLGGSFYHISKKLLCPPIDTEIVTEFGLPLKAWHRSIVDSWIADQENNLEKASKLGNKDVNDFRLLKDWVKKYKRLQYCNNLGQELSRLSIQLNCPPRDTKLMNKYGTFLKEWPRLVVETLIGQLESK